MTQKKKTFYGWFPALLLLTLLCCTPKLLGTLLPAKLPQPPKSDTEAVPPQEKLPEAPPEEPPEEAPEKVPEKLPEEAPEEVPEEVPEDVLEEVPEEVSEIVPEEAPKEVSEETPEEVPEDAPEEASEENPDAAPPPSMDEFFSDVLFIGDSRTVGLCEYSGLGTATFFADVGMNVYQVWKSEVAVSGVGTVTLEELLEQRTFGKIHLMLGINELGYDFDTTIQTYGTVIEKIRSLQPDAVVYLGANLHVDKARSDRDKTINNPAIDRFNEAVAGLADGEQIRYVDVNPLFDDENGALDASSSGDGTHPYGSCYPQWAEWLYEAMQEETT